MGTTPLSKLIVLGVAQLEIRRGSHAQFHRRPSSAGLHFSNQATHTLLGILFYPRESPQNSTYIPTHVKTTNQTIHTSKCHHFPN